MQHRAILAAAASLAAIWANPAIAEEGAPRDSRALDVTPYIEIAQVLTAEISPGSDTLTYTQLAAGVDATLVGRNNGGSVSIRYERNIAWNGNGLDSDAISGVARGYASIVPGSLTFEAGALASRTQVDSNGASSTNPLVSQDRESRIYSLYAGPTVHTRAGDVEVNALGRVGYTRLESPGVIASGGANPLDIFDESVTYRGEVHLATKPHQPLPVGLGLGGGVYQEDISNLDQRVRDAWVRGDVSVPLTPTFAVVAGIGYENVEISSRDALRDTNGDPIIGSGGRFVTDPNAPRQIAYDVDGLIWDVGVVWKPSRRTALEAHVGRRYDSTTYYGSFTWAPSRRSNVNIAAYDGITGFGGVLTNSLAALPTQFNAIRNGLSGDFTGCVSGDQGASCLGGVLGSVRSATFRGRGVQASYSRRFGHYTAVIAAGYDRRKFIAAAGTVLGLANGATDENYYLANSVSGDLGRNASFSVSSYINWFDSGFAGNGNVTALGTSAAYVRNLGPRLAARGAVSFDKINSDVSAEDIAAVSALLGLRYSF